MQKPAASWEFLTHKGAGIQTQPFSPRFFLLCPAEGSVLLWGLPEADLRQEFKCKLLIWKVNETPIVKCDKKREEKEANKRRVNKLVTLTGSSGGLENRISKVREVGYLYSHYHKPVFGLLPQGVNFPYFLLAVWVDSEDIAGQRMLQAKIWRQLLGRKVTHVQGGWVGH